MSPGAPVPAALVLFDLDGTLVDTAPEICDAVNGTLSALGLPTVRPAQVVDWIGHGTDQLLVQALAHACARPAAAVRDSALWRTAQPRFALEYEARSGTTGRLYPQAREVLHGLAERGVRRALVTNKEQRFTLPVLRRHGLRQCFDRIVCGDTLPTRKPDPAGVHDCLQALGVDRRDAVFVGDSSVDVATARNAGLPAWVVPHGYNLGAPIAASRPDRLLAGLADLLQAVPAA